MDILKENDTVNSTVRGGLKNNMVTFPMSRKLNVLSDVRNTVHQKNASTSLFSKQFLEPETRQELRTPSPDRKSTPLVVRHERDEPKVLEHPEDLDDNKYTCKCNFDNGDNDHESGDENKVFEEYDLLEDVRFNNRDFDMFGFIWYGFGRDVPEGTPIFCPNSNTIIRKEMNLDAVVEKVEAIEIPSNDSGIGLDIDLEMDQDF